MSTEHETRAVLLRSVDYGESDRILSLFTESRGRIGAIAKGARRSRRRLFNAVQPFCLFRGQLQFGKGDLARLKAVEILEPHSRIMSDLGRIQLASAAMALFRVALPEHAQEATLFEDTVGFLKVLNAPERPRMEHLLSFLVHVLAALGLAPRFDRCGQCGREPRPSQPSYFDPYLGALGCSTCGQGLYLLAPQARALLSAGWVSGEQGQMIPLGVEERQQAYRALRAFVEEHLGATIIYG